MSAVLALNELAENGVDFSQVERCAGTSIGALIALLVIVKVLPSRHNADALRTLFVTHFDRYNTSVWRGLGRLLTRFGMFPSTVLSEFVRACFAWRRIEAVDEDVTFGELFAKTGKVLVVTVHNVHTMENVYVHHAAYPSAKVLECVVASMSFPLAFEPVRSLELGGREVGKSWYVDGGVLDNFPVALFSQATWEEKLFSEVDWSVEIKDTLAFKMLSQEEQYARDVYLPRRAEPLGLVAYVTRCVYTALAYHCEGVRWSASAARSTLKLPYVGAFSLNSLREEHRFAELKERVRQSVLEFLRAGGS